MKTKNIILLAYGNTIEYKRAIFCVLSFWSWFSGNALEIRILIYTDQPNYFEPFLNEFPIEYQYLNTQMLEEMLGESDYIHRRKVMVIDETFKKYPEDDLLFIDSDTFFISDPSKWLTEFKLGESYMHLREYTFAQGLELFSSFGGGKEPKAFIDFLELKPLTIAGESLSFDRNDYCWNSGVLGLTNDISSYIPDVLRLTDDFYKNSSWFISEQLAFSLVLQTKTKIFSSDTYVYHYWGKRQKVLMDKLIESKFTALQKHHRDKTYLRELVLNFCYKIKTDVMIEQAGYALSKNKYAYGIRKAIFAWFRNPMNKSFIKELKEAGNQK